MLSKDNGWERDQLAYNGEEMFYQRGNEWCAVDSRGNPRAVDKKEIDKAHKAYFKVSYQWCCAHRDAALEGKP